MQKFLFISFLALTISSCTNDFPNEDFLPVIQIKEVKDISFDGVTLSAEVFKIGNEGIEHAFVKWKLAGAPEYPDYSYPPYFISYYTNYVRELDPETIEGQRFDIFIKRNLIEGKEYEAILEFHTPNYIIRSNSIKFTALGSTSNTVSFESSFPSNFSQPSYGAPTPTGLIANNGLEYNANLKSWGNSSFLQSAGITVYNFVNTCIGVNGDYVFLSDIKQRGNQPYNFSVYDFNSGNEVVNQVVTETYLQLLFVNEQYNLVYLVKNDFSKFYRLNLISGEFIELKKFPFDPPYRFKADIYGENGAMLIKESPNSPYKLWEYNALFDEWEESKISALPIDDDFIFFVGKKTLWSNPDEASPIHYKNNLTWEILDYMPSSGHRILRANNYTFIFTVEGIYRLNL
ncbi:MAG: hypothetical protein Kow0027_12140 [Saprospiraceae bacterium]